MWICHQHHQIVTLFFSIIICQQYQCFHLDIDRRNLYYTQTITTSYYTPTTQDTTLNNIKIQFFSSSIKSVNSILHQMCKLHQMWLLHQIVCTTRNVSSTPDCVNTTPISIFYLFNRDAYKIYLGLCFCSFSIFWEFECRYLTLISIDWNRTKRQMQSNKILSSQHYFNQFHIYIFIASVLPWKSQKWTEDLDNKH